MRQLIPACALKFLSLILVLNTRGWGLGVMNVGENSENFGNKVLDVRKVFENSFERKGKALAISNDIDEGDSEDLDDLTDLNKVIPNEENHNDPVLDVISAFFGLDDENITNLNEKNGEVTEVNNDLSKQITSDDKDINAKQINSNQAQNKPFAQLRSGPRKAKLSRGGRVFDVPGGLDFSNAVFNEKLGKLCMEKKEEIESIEKSPVLECSHKSVEQCHYTYITKYRPSQEEICDENYEKVCQISYATKAVNDTIMKCYTPVVKVCSGAGPEECRTVYESSCSTKYVESETNKGKFLADTACEKLPIEICGAGCTYEDGKEECHDKVVTTVISVPEEVCDLNPQKSCRLSTKLVPKLEPVRECTVVPKESCRMVFGSPRVVKKPLMTVWCLDESEETIPETEKTAEGFLSSSRRANLSELEFELQEELDNEVDGVLEVNTKPINLEPLNLNENPRPVLDIDELSNEITLENEFVKLLEDYEDTRVEVEDVFDYDFNPELDEELAETQTNPIITIGLAATTSPPLNLRARQRKNLVIDRRLSVPARIRPPVLAYDANLEVPRLEMSQGLDPRIGLPKLQFLRVKETDFDSDNLIGPQIPSVGLRNSGAFDQNMFQTRFY